MRSTGPGLGDAAGIHDDDVVAHVGDDAEVVRDEDDGHAELLLERLHELEDLRLDGDIEGGGGLVGDDDGGLQARAMAMTTRWRMPPESWWGYSPIRISGEGMPTLRSISTERRRASRCPWSGAGGRPRSAAGRWCAPGLSAVIGSWKIMPMRPPRMRCISAAAGGEIDGRRTGPAALDAAHRLREQAHDGEGGDALAAAGFADDAEGAAAADGEAHAVDGGEPAGVGVEGRDEVADLETGGVDRRIRARRAAGRD
jgi:hypothetical protein